jgi:hypothetical protein
MMMHHTILVVQRLLELFSKIIRETHGAVVGAVLQNDMPRMKVIPTLRGMHTTNQRGSSRIKLYVPRHYHRPPMHHQCKGISNDPTQRETHGASTTHAPFLSLSLILCVSFPSYRLSMHHTFLLTPSTVPLSLKHGSVPFRWDRGGRGRSVGHGDGIVVAEGDQSALET